MFKNLRPAVRLLPAELQLMLTVVKAITLTALCLRECQCHCILQPLIPCFWMCLKSHPDPDRYLQAPASSSLAYICLPRHSANTFVSFFFRGRGLTELTLKYITTDKRAERLRSSRGACSRAGGQAPARTSTIKTKRGRGSQGLQILPHLP